MVWWGLRGHGKLCELGAGSDMYTTSVVLGEGQRAAGAGEGRGSGEREEWQRAET